MALSPELVLCTGLERQLDLDTHTSCCCPSRAQSSFCWLQWACKELRKALQRVMQAPEVGTKQKMILDEAVAFLFQWPLRPSISADTFMDFKKPNRF